MPRVFIPPSLRSLTGGVDQLDVEGGTVRQVVRTLAARFPGIESRLCEGGAIKPGLTVAIDGNISSAGLMQKVASTSEIHFLPAIGGG